MLRIPGKDRSLSWRCQAIASTMPLRRRLLLHLEDPFPGFRAPALNPARQFVLPLQLDDCVLLGDLGVGVAGDLAGLDAAAADFLPPRDVGAAQRVGPEAPRLQFLRCRHRLQTVRTHIRASLGGFWGDPAVHGWVNSGKDG